MRGSDEGAVGGGTWLGITSDSASEESTPRLLLRSPLLGLTEQGLGKLGTVCPLVCGPLGVDVGGRCGR